MTKKEWTIIGVLGVAVLGCLGVLMLTMLTTPPRQAERVAVSDLLPSVTPAQLPTQLSATQVKPTMPPQPTPRPTETPQPTNTPQPTLTLSPAQAFAALARNSGEEYHLTLNIPAKIENGQATAEYKLDTDFYSEESILRSITLTFRKLAPDTFKTFPQVNTLLTGVMVPFKDVYGKTKLDTGVMFKITRTTADKMNWGTYNSFNLDKILTGKGDLFYIADPLVATWKMLAK
jgi:hypothetical protein